MSDRSEYFRAYNAGRREKQRAYYKAHPEHARRYVERHGPEIRARQRARRAANPAATHARDKAWRDANPDKVWAARLRLAGLTSDRYEAMLAAQGGACAMCRRPERFVNRRTGLVQRLAVDHDHRCCPGTRSCGRCIRGLLCHACNVGVGKLSDDPALLRAAATYLESFSA